MNSTIGPFNFCIGTVWPGTDQLCVYRIHNTDIHYGSMKTAQSLLKYVQQQSPGQTWRIIPIPCQTQNTIQSVATNMAFTYVSRIQDYDYACRAKEWCSDHYGARGIQWDWAQSKYYTWFFFETEQDLMWFMLNYGVEDA